MAEFDAFLVRCWALMPVTRDVRASLDAGRRKGESMDMENRITVLERDVTAIKSELALIRRDHVDPKELIGRVQRVEFEITQLQKSVSQLTADVLQLKEEVVSIRIELTRLSALQANFVTKADMKALEANIKGWMLGIALTVLSLNFGMNVIFLNAQKTTGAPKPAHVLHTIPSEQAAPDVPK